MTENQYNQSPLNQASRRQLRNLNQPLTPESLPSVQLLVWALESRKYTGEWDPYQDDLLEQAEVMLRWDPQTVHKLLPQNLDPQDNLPLQLLEAFWDRIKEVRPQFRQNLDP